MKTITVISFALVAATTSSGCLHLRTECDDPAKEWECNDESRSAPDASMDLARPEEVSAPSSVDAPVSHDAGMSKDVTVAVGVDSAIEANSASVAPSVDPPNGAEKVSVLATISVQLAGPVDESSISSSVKLYIEGRQTLIPVSISYDASNLRIVVAPKAPLRRATRYRVEVDGLRAGSRELPRLASRFRTFINPQVSSISYGTECGAIRFETDDEGRTVVETSYVPGSDGVCLTSDDVIWNVRRHDWSPNRRIGRNISAPGPDGKWNTTDDVLRSYWVDDLRAGLVTLQRSYEMAGPDGKWLTQDDVSGHTMSYKYDDLDRDIGHTSFKGLGPDGLAHTGDDEISYYSVREYEGECARLRTYWSPGSDQAWFTRDDVATEFSREVCDSLGRRIATEGSGAGPDGVSGTADDTAYFARWIRDARGLVTEFVEHSAPGPDKRWGTSDDAISTYEKFSFDERGNATTAEMFDPGPDRVPYNVDDLKVRAYVFDTSR